MKWDRIIEEDSISTTGIPIYQINETNFKYIRYSPWLSINLTKQLCKSLGHDDFHGLNLPHRNLNIAKEDKVFIGFTENRCLCKFLILILNYTPQ